MNKILMKVMEWLRAAEQRLIVAGRQVKRNRRLLVNVALPRLKDGLEEGTPLTVYGSPLTAHNSQPIDPQPCTPDSCNSLNNEERLMINGKYKNENPSIGYCLHSCTPDSCNSLNNEERLMINGKYKNENPSIDYCLHSCTPDSCNSLNNEAPSLMLRMEEFVAGHYDVRYNRLSQQYELAYKGTGQWMRLDDEFCCRMLMEMNRAGIAVAKPYLVRTVVQGGTLARAYHPVCSYLENLPEWDGMGHIEGLFRRVTDDEQLLAWLRKWFIAMVAQVMGRMGTYGNSVCPILISTRQGWGKSQFAKLLVPPQLRVFYTDTFNLAQEDACLRRMTAYMLVNVDEVDRFKDTRMATFKNLVQLAAVSMKRAYRSQMEERERMASFIATSNRRYLLHDESGSRRFICVELSHPIDVDTPIDYEQLYAEAMAALDRGERCWFDEEETRLLEAHNADYSARRGAWDLLNRHFVVCDIPEDAEERLDTLWPATEVYDYLCDLSPTAMAGIERTGFAHYLKRMGAQQVRVKNRRLYGVMPMNLKIEN